MDILIIFVLNNVIMLVVVGVMIKLSLMLFLVVRLCFLVRKILRLYNLVLWVVLIVVILVVVVIFVLMMFVREEGIVREVVVSVLFFKKLWWEVCMILL